MTELEISSLWVKLNSLVRAVVKFYEPAALWFPCPLPCTHPEQGVGGGEGQPWKEGARWSAKHIKRPAWEPCSWPLNQRKVVWRFLFTSGDHCCLSGLGAAPFVCPRTEIQGLSWWGLPWNCVWGGAPVLWRIEVGVHRNGDITAVPIHGYTRAPLCLSQVILDLSQVSLILKGERQFWADGRVGGYLLCIAICKAQGGTIISLITRMAN